MNESQVVYLSNAAALLPSAGDLCQLKSHFLWGGSVSAGRAAVAKISNMCPKCCRAWSDGKFSLKLKSSTVPGPRMLKILRKTERTPHRLNRVETSLLERYKHNNRNKMVLICRICENETLMQFKKRISEEQKPIETPTICIDTPQSLRKKKKKDRFAGLNASAVIAATPSPTSVGRKYSMQTNKVISTATPIYATGQLQTITPRGIPNWTNSTPHVPKTQSEPIKLKTGLLSAKRKMNTLREEVRQAEQDRVKEGKKALTTRNLNIRRNDKLQMFLSKKEKDVHLEDRINSLLQL